MGCFKDRVSKNKCGRCGKNEIVFPVKVCPLCREKANNFQKAVRDRKRKQKQCMNCMCQITDDYVRCKKCREKMISYGKGNKYKKNVKKHRDKIRNRVFELYGNECVWCGENNKVVLVIDHICGGGNKHVKQIKNSLNSCVVKKYQPKKYQILCRNCNWIKYIDSIKHKKRNVSNLLMRNKVLDAYGAKCGCCGITKRSSLTIDHINEDGAAHRRMMTGKNAGAGGGICKWLIDNNFPEGYQILCCNCNWAKTRKLNKRYQQSTNAPQ